MTTKTPVNPLSIRVIKDFSMTQRKKFASVTQKRLALLHGLSGLIGLGLLSGGVTLAQAIDDFEPAASAPTAEAPAVVAPSAPEVSESFAPSAPSVVEAPIDSGNAFIDRTSYDLGATQYDPAPVIVNRPAIATGGSGTDVPVSAAPVQVGAISLSSSGIRWNPGGTTAIGREYSTVRQYYNRTVRPPSVLGNGNIRLIFPLAIPASITSVFGWRIHPITGNSRFHAGTDLGAPMGTPVLAAYAGQVALADFFGGYGLAVAINHNKATQQTLYAHLSEIFVKPGDWIQQGTVLGRVGSTGASTGPHLHFEFRQLTTQGWAAIDSGTQLETALGELVKALQVAQTTGKPAQGSAKPNS